MCGIAALLATSLPEREAARLVEQSLRYIAHRGEPAYQGEQWSFPRFWGGANRLPFTSGDEPQPALDESRRFAIFLNGEFYSLHGLVDAAGRPVSDTRAFAQACLERGVERAIADQRGMYALIIVDTAERVAYLARDPFGIKPLYLARTCHGVLVGSELKALTCHDFVDRIEHVEPGGLLRITADGTIERLRGLHVQPAADETDEAGFAAQLKHRLLQALVEHTRDRQSYAVYLSGGIDSSVVYALAKETGADVVPLVLGTSEAGDVSAARAVAAYYGDDLEIIPCPGEDVLFESIEETIRICESFEPNVVRQSTVSRVLAEGARALGCRVALCGEGADELFGGYPEFWQAGVDFASMRQAFLRDLPRTQLQRVDRVNMAATIEVRVPFLSDQVAALALSKTKARDFAASPAGLHAKLPLRQAMTNLLPKTIIEREKVVLSEGAGLRGNSPTDGMFSDYFQSGGAHLDLEPSVRHAWGLKSREELFYFSVFQRLGYDSCYQARERVFANVTTTRSAGLARTG